MQILSICVKLVKNFPYFEANNNKMLIKKWIRGMYVNAICGNTKISRYSLFYALYLSKTEQIRTQITTNRNLFSLYVLFSKNPPHQKSNPVDITLIEAL